MPKHTDVRHNEKFFASKQNKTLQYIKETKNELADTFTQTYNHSPGFKNCNHLKTKRFKAN